MLIAVLFPISDLVGISTWRKISEDFPHVTFTAIYRGPIFSPFIDFITILEAHRSLDLLFFHSFFIADHLWFTVIHQSCGSCREFGTSPKIMVSFQKKHLFFKVKSLGYN